MIGRADTFKDSARFTHVKPVLDYVTRIAELLALAAAFKIAADRSDSFLLSALAFLLPCVVGAYVGLPLGLLNFAFKGVRTKSLLVALAIAMPVGIAGGLATAYVSVKASHAVANLSEASGK